MDYIFVFSTPPADSNIETLIPGVTVFVDDQVRG